MSLAIKHPDAVLFQKKDYEQATFGGKTVGKVREYGNLSYSVVYNSGHLVPMSVPEYALDMFRRAIGWQDMATGTRDVRTHQIIPLTPDPPVDPRPQPTTKTVKRETV